MVITLKLKKDLKIRKFQVFDTELIKIIKWYNSIKKKKFILVKN